MSRKFSNLEVPKQLITITQSHEQNYKNSVRNPHFFSVKNVAVPLWAHLHTYLKMSTWTVVVLVE